MFNNSDITEIIINISDISEIVNRFNDIFSDLSDIFLMYNNLHFFRQPDSIPDSLPDNIPGGGTQEAQPEPGNGVNTEKYKKVKKLRN